MKPLDMKTADIHYWQPGDPPHPADVKLVTEGAFTYLATHPADDPIRQWIIQVFRENAAKQQEAHREAG